ncbi:hypothetical protein Clacol_003980 [Clathrus columnatus]|uniref:Uncharacterized protein n=1 Tax=Clathrus columnatus TaxID=1419009 RepID=A0AAV5ABA3_9AGAM|nr:hypothetical protein Clacol_003980 [Clathrus columnatus]
MQKSQLTAAPSNDTEVKDFLDFFWFPFLADWWECMEDYRSSIEHEDSIEWTPQDVILGHSATVWFLTHCGNNSVTWPISSGVPFTCSAYYLT